MQVARSAEIMATTLTQFRLPAEQAAHVSDVLAAGAGKAQGSVDDLALALTYVGPLAGSVGLSLDETAGTIAYFATQGIIGEKAGTSLRGVLASLQAPSAAAASEMDRYNISMFDGNGNMLSIAGIAEQLKTRLGGLTQQERLAALGRIFGNESLNAATLLYEGGAAAVNEWTAAVDDSGYAAEQARIRQDNLAGDIEKLGGAFDTALIRTGSAANDVLRGMTQAVTELVDVYAGWPQPIQATALALGVATAAILLFGGGAIGARVKFLELKAALADTNTTMGKTARAGAGAGLALTGIITVVGLLMAKQAAARAVAESYADTIEEGTNRVGEAARDLAIDELLKGGEFLTFNWQSAADAAEKLGVGLDVVTDAALKDKDAIDDLSRYYAALSGDQDAFNQIQQETGMNAYETRLALEAMINGIQAQNDGINQGIRLKKQEEDANKGSAEGTKTAAEAYLAEADSVEQLNNELSKLLDQINESNSNNQDAISANADYQAALAGISDEVQKQKDAYAAANGTLDGFTLSMDRNTEAGSANVDSLAGVAAAAQEASAKQFEVDLQTMSANDAALKWNDTLAAQKQAFIDSSIEAGYNADRVHDLADEVFNMPTPEQIKITVDTATARTQIHDFMRDYGSQTINVWLNPKTQALNDAFAGYLNGIKKADGGIVNFADGGIRPSIAAFAQGGMSENHVAQFARAGEYLIWAEPETGGEAYIPLAPSKRARSEQIMAVTAERLGGRYIPSDAASYADGGGSVVPGGPASSGGPTYVFPATIHNSDPRFAVRQVADEFRREFGSE
ncbi:phage tail tape measure protein [Microbacterium sp. Root1433D1]|uniref:phage tail tape measure protein n=1 Tax=Microbacterium sp. Root1433D1 TaxID=1736463 RepID=UPI002285DB98|nr:phage tail tape measure protein [Microbacterium sp. Root1433D1]